MSDLPIRQPNIAAPHIKGNVAPDGSESEGSQARYSSLPESDAAAVLSAMRRVHILGLGGVGMSALAEWLCHRKVEVSGSDREDSATLHRLRELGVTAWSQHDPAHLAGADAVIYSSAIPVNHPVRAASEAAGIPQFHRAELLAALTGGRRVLAVAGTHGKTTTTAALAVVWAALGRDPTAVVGGQVADWAGRNLLLGGSDWTVVEADESDGSFLHLQPEAVVLTSVEADHLNHHGDIARLEQAFVQFVSLLPPDGYLVYCADDPGARRVAASHAGPNLSYGEAVDADYRITALQLAPGRMTWQVSDAQGTTNLASRIMGRHNAFNLTAVFALARAYGIGTEANPIAVPDAETDAAGTAEINEDSRSVQGALAAFGGVARRQEWIGKSEGYTVYDDYAHHPTEVRATLEMFLAVHGRPLTVIFQPHLYSRTAQFAREFALALGLADRVVVTDVYAAREVPLPCVSGASIVSEMAGHPAAHYVPDWREAWETLPQPGVGVLVTMGAGDITRLGRERVLLQSGQSAALASRTPSSA